MSIRHVVLLLSLLISLGARAQSPIDDRDPAKLHLASINAVVMDTRSNKILYSSNANEVVPIASVSKLMTAMVVLDAKLPMNEKISVDIHHTKELKNVFSRLRIGSTVSRRDMMLMALMASENRAAASLAHHYPGGYDKFIEAMNAKAKSLGMNHTHFVEPTGLSQHNVSTAHDLAIMVQAAARYHTITELTTTAKKDFHFHHPRYVLAYYNTNPLVRNRHWDIRLTKTGYTDEAGRCLVMMTKIKDRPVAMVLLDSFGKRTRLGDAMRVKRWLETGESTRIPASAKSYRREKLSEMNELTQS